MTKKIVFLFAFLLVLLSLRFLQATHNASNYNNGELVGFETRLLKEPRISGNYQRFSVVDQKGNEIFITAPRFPQFHYGETVRISGRIEERALKNKKIIIAMFLPQIEANQNSSSLGLKAVSDLRQKIISAFEKTLPSTSSSLLLGIVFGIKQTMPKDFQDNLRISGVLHVIAASGMNVTMVASFLSSIMVLFFSRRLAILISVFGILFYAVLSGLEPSIIRASIMGILVFTAQILGKQTLSVYALFLTGYIMLFFSPNLISDIGFQLSFVSTLGLLFIRPFFKTKKIIIEDIATSFAAQISTLPILLVNFGTYSLLSIAINGLVLWTIPILMVFGGIGAILGMVFWPLGQLFLYLSLPFLIYFEKIVNLFSGIGGVVSVNNFEWPFITAYYLFLASFIIFFKQKDAK